MTKYKIQMYYKTYLLKSRYDWKTTDVAKYPSVIQQMCQAAQQYRDVLTFNYYFPLATDQEPEQHETYTMSTLPRISPGATQTSNTSHQFNVDLIDLEKLATLVRDQQQQDSTDRIQLTVRRAQLGSLLGARIGAWLCRWRLA